MLERLVARGVAFARVAVVLSLWAIPFSAASAQDPTEPDTSPSSAVTIRGRGDRRSVPDYDRLPERGPSAEEVALWLPRALLSPLYFVSEYLVRRPLGALATLAERESWALILVSVFTWDHQRAGIVPTVFYDFGFLPSVGLYFFWNDLGAPGHDLRVQVGFGGIDYLMATVRDRVVVGPAELSFAASALTRPDGAFQGFGRTADPASRGRYRRAQIGGSAQLSLSPWRRSVVSIAVGLESNQFDPHGYVPTHSDPSIADMIANGGLGSLPIGFGGYLAYRQRLRLTVDSREDAPAAGHGLRVDAFAEQSVDLLAPVASRWIRWGGGAAVFVDMGEERIVSLHVRAMFADPLGGGGLPFTEHVVLGGGVLDLPGFWRGALVDRSSTVLTLRYRWPIWVHLDASLFVGAGNVFAEHLGDFAVERLRLGWGMAIQTPGDRDQGLRIVLAFGTRTFEQGGSVESFRFGIGGNLDL